MVDIGNDDRLVVVHLLYFYEWLQVHMVLFNLLVYNLARVGTRLGAIERPRVLRNCCQCAPHCAR